MQKLSYVPEVDDLLPPTRPATLLRIPADAFKSKETLRAHLRGAAPHQTKTLGSALNAAAAAAAGSDGAPLKPYKRSRAEPIIDKIVEEVNLPQFKRPSPIYRHRNGKPVRTYKKFHQE